MDIDTSDALKLACVWKVKERDPRTGLFLPKLQRKNVFTTFGLTALASAIGGGYTFPNSLVMEGFGSSILDPSGVAVGATSVTLGARVDQTGDNQLILSPGLPAQETVTFSAVNPNAGLGGFTYTLSAPTTRVHPLSDPACRVPSANDTMVNVAGEIQYDPTNAPNARIQSATGYSQGPGNFTIQFYVTGIQALTTIYLIGLSDSVVLGGGNLHNHVVLGYTHPLGTDVEIDGSLTLTNA